MVRHFENVVLLFEGAKTPEISMASMKDIYLEQFFLNVNINVSDIITNSKSLKISDIDLILSLETKCFAV